MGLGFTGTSLSLSLPPFLSLSLSLSDSSRAEATLILQAEQTVMTHECFTGRRSVGCAFTAYNWFKCINTGGVILYLYTLTPIADLHLKILMILTDTMK